MKREPGFTLIELLIALTVTILLAGAVASTITPARQTFDRVPAELDLQQRGRSAIDSLSQMLRAAVAITSAADTLTVITPIANGAQGALAVEPSGVSLLLAASPCPHGKDVCGFVPGTTAVIADSNGHYDMFVVVATNTGMRMLSADRGFSRTYPAGSTIVEIDRYDYRLAAQADGSFSLIRESAAGAIQPMVDFVSGWSFAIAGNRVDLSLRVNAATSALRSVVADRVFRMSVQLRNVS